MILIKEGQMSIKILLADDSITIQKVVGIIFGGEEYSLTVVDNGKAAVEKAQEINPDVLLIDALMPGMSGYEVCEAVRAIPSLADKPIILLTGTFEKFDEEKAKSCGADDSMAKPFESQQIITKVKEMLELGSSRTSAPAPATATPAAVVEPETAATPVAPPVAEEPVVSDIWDAFTPLDESPDAATQSFSAEPSFAEELDPFDMISAEPEAVGTAPAAIIEPANDSTGSKWIPSEEETFEFGEETIAELPSAVFDEPVAETSGAAAFGDIAFDEPDDAELETVAFEEPEAPAAPAFSEPVTQSIPAAVVEEVIPVCAAPVAAAAIPAEVTEEQLRAAIAGASREVIERIVWEVVPDLAEVMIKEAIQKIRQGA
jgi:CheY-like chemotaxis protein